MTETASTRRTPRRPQPVDTELFAGDVDEALAAFRSDDFYAVAMARAAVAITAKRAQVAARRDLIEAETRAHAECRRHTFDCHAYAACGTGDCKFAVGEHAALTVAAPGGTRRRPQYPYETYSLDEAVNRLVDTRIAAR